MDEARELYLELMKKCLVNSLYDEVDLASVFGKGPWGRRADAALSRFGVKWVRAKGDARANRSAGRDNNPRAHTMIGLGRLENIQSCVEEVLAANVPGDLIEAGVWRGGAAIFMRAILKADGIADRTVWVADSFQGLPPPDAGKYPVDRGDPHHQYRWLAIPLEEVRDTFDRYGLLDGQVRFLEGWFRDTLGTGDIEELAVIRLDGDMYESTMDGLVHLYPKLSIGGYIILDDWGLIPNCRRAIDDFRAARGITEPVHATADGVAGYWRRER